MGRPYILHLLQHSDVPCDIERPPWLRQLKCSGKRSIGTRDAELFEMGHFIKGTHNIPRYKSTRNVNLHSSIVDVNVSSRDPKDESKRLCDVILVNLIDWYVYWPTWSHNFARYTLLRVAVISSDTATTTSGCNAIGTRPITRTEQVGWEVLDAGGLNYVSANIVSRIRWSPPLRFLSISAGLTWRFGQR